MLRLPCGGVRVETGNEGGAAHEYPSFCLHLTMCRFLPDLGDRRAVELPGAFLDPETRGTMTQSTKSPRDCARCPHVRLSGDPLVVVHRQAVN